jgi:hypothetical protein
MTRTPESDNLARWDGRPGRYEVYYLKLNHGESGRAFWFRYTLLAPSDPARPALAELWAIAFDPDRPERHLALKRSFPAGDAAIGRSPFRLAFGPAVLTHGEATGELSDPAGSRLRWDLRIDPEAETLRHFPHDLMYRLAVPKTKVLAPHPDARFHGTVEWDGESFACRGEPGQQAHLWGTRYAERWVWGHGNRFADRPDLLFEFLTARIRVGPVPVPELSLFFLRRHGRLHRLDALWRAPLQHARADLPAFRFAAAGDGLRLRGTARAPLHDFVAVEYTDPDGSKRWCHNTKIADLDLEIEPRGERPERVRCPRAFALEFVQRDRDPRIPRRI